MNSYIIHNYIYLFNFKKSGCSCGTPSTEISGKNGVDNTDNESEDDSLNQSTQSNFTSQTKEGSDQVSGKSTNDPLRKTALSKRKQADEEYQLIKELSLSIANKNKRKRAERKNGF